MFFIDSIFKHLVCAADVPGQPSTVLSPASAAGGAEQLPQPQSNTAVIYYTTLSVTYNTTPLTEVSSECGAYYARTFLENFIKAEPYLEKLCNEKIDRNLAGQIQVNISLVARVLLRGFLVSSYSKVPKDHHLPTQGLCTATA